MRPDLSESAPLILTLLAGLAVLVGWAVLA
jgi:hypothetical protein